MSRDEQLNEGRRHFLGVAAGGIAGSAGGVGVVVALSALTGADDADAAQRAEPVDDRHRWGLFIDTSKCAEGCSACVDACAEENGLDLQVRPHGQAAAKWQNQRSVWVRKVKLEDKVSGHVTNLPLMCQHCEHPPCVNVCPTGASFKHADGIVMAEQPEFPTGLRTTGPGQDRAGQGPGAGSLPDQSRAPRGKGCVESCNLCAHRRDDGQDSTACADACAALGHNAIVFGDIKDPTSPLRKALRGQPSRQIREDLGLNTGVRYAGL